MIVIDSLGSGGAEKSTQVLCEFLVHEKVPFEIICLDKRDIGVQQDMISKGYTIHFINTLQFVNQVNFIADHIKGSNFTVVHSVLFRSNIRVRLCKLKVKFTHLESLVNTTYASHRFLDPRVNKLGLHYYKMIDKLTAKQYVDHFHSITRAVKQHYIQQLNLPSDQITVIYRGRNAEQKAEKVAMAEFGFEESDFVIVNTGRHEFQKGQIQLIKAMNTLLARGYKNIKLLVLGRDGSCTAAMKAFIEQNNLESTVCLAGYRHNVPEILSSCDIFAFSSYYEGLGGAVIEAQAAGLPVVCNDIDVLREVVVEGKNAAFFDSDNVDSIVEKILLFYNSPELCQTYAKGSRENFEANFNLDSVHHQMLELYKNLSAQLH